MARDRSVSFDPSLKTTLNEKAGAVEVGSNWNMDNIERIRKSTSDMLSSIGEGMVAYATKMKERQIASDLQAVDSYRERLWSEAQNELENSPEINTEEKLKAFWERKSSEINDVINKDYKENARWLDSTQEYVEAMNGQMSAKAFVGFNRELIRKNKARDAEIFKYTANLCLKQPDNEELFNRTLELGRRNGWTPEQEKMFRDKHEYAKTYKELSNDVAYANGLISEEARMVAIDTIVAKIKGGYYALNDDVLIDAQNSLLTSRRGIVKEIEAIKGMEVVGNYQTEIANACNLTTSEQTKKFGELEQKINSDKTLTSSSRSQLLGLLKKADLNNDKVFVGETKGEFVDLLAKIKNDNKAVEKAFDKAKEKYEYLKKKNPTLYKMAIQEIETAKVNYFKAQQERLLQAIKAKNENENKIASQALKNAISGETPTFDFSGTGAKNWASLEAKIPNSEQEANDLKDALRIEMNGRRIDNQNRAITIYSFAKIINTRFGGNEYAHIRRELFEELYDVTDGNSPKHATKTDINSYLVGAVGKPNDDKRDSFTRLTLQVEDALKIGGYSIADFNKNPNAVPMVASLIEAYQNNALLNEQRIEALRQKRFAKTNEFSGDFKILADAENKILKKLNPAK